ncbi:hypothetical protein KY360_01130, partial [Candidatus Woesearchaeota archaeon]|nr:hypothetical protein [Candidatus Woesearchaeota archaeon]
VATSIGEEGLDIPKVDFVIFFEPVPSAIRTIQRKGRTGRLEKGRVTVLMTEGTRDEGYRWSAHHKQKRMYRNLDNLRKKVSFELKRKKDHSLDKYKADEDKIKIFADYREKGSGTIKELVELGADLKLEKLENADYLVSSRCGVEVKTTEDFVNSIIDGRLLQQIKELRRNFERPVVLIEGIDDIYSVRNVHANAIRGMLATIAVSYGIPILHSRNAKETAALLQIIAKREQEVTGKDYTLHGEKRAFSMKNMQEYIISALPGVGATLAKPLLKALGSVKNIVNADVEELQKVEKIGPKKAKQIKDVVDSDYSETS